MLSVIYLIFFSINILTYFGLTSVYNFMAILERLGKIFEMEEFAVATGAILFRAIFICGTKFMMNKTEISSFEILH